MSLRFLLDWGGGGNAELESTLKESQEPLEPHPRGGASFQHYKPCWNFPLGLDGSKADLGLHGPRCPSVLTETVGDVGTLSFLVFLETQRAALQCSGSMRPCLAFRVYILIAPPKSRASVIRPFLPVLKTLTPSTMAMLGVLPLASTPEWLVRMSTIMLKLYTAQTRFCTLCLPDPKAPIPLIPSILFLVPFTGFFLLRQRRIAKDGLELLICIR